jgi:hypothetical protein
MTPKEKAQELVDMFMEHTVEWDNVKGVAFDSEYHAKKCALIAVDEIQNVIYSQKTTLSISAYKKIEDFNHDIRYNDSLRHSKIFYFDFVKQEIEKL